MRLARPPRPSSVRVPWTLVQLLPLLAFLLVMSTVVDRGAVDGDVGPILAAAHRILEGHYAVLGTSNPVDFLWHGPGLPAFLAPLIALGTPLSELRLTSPLLMFAAVLLFYRLLRFRLSHRPALIGAYALGLYGPAYYVLGSPAKEPLALVLSIIALNGTARYIRSGRRRQAVVAGLAFGALAMTRLEYGWVIAIMLAVGVTWSLAAWLRHGTASRQTRTARRWMTVCAVGMLACVPWLAYTYALTGHLFYWGNSGGLSLFWMSVPGQLGEWQPLHSVFVDPALASYRAFFSHLATLSPVQADLALQHAAIGHALAHPASYALNLLANIGRTFIGWPFAFALSDWALVGMIVINLTLIVGVLAAARSALRGRISLPSETAPFVLFASVGLAIHLFFTSEPRMVIPIIPVPIWLIAQALHRRVPAYGWQQNVMIARALHAPRFSRPRVEMPRWLPGAALSARALRGRARADQARGR